MIDIRSLTEVEVTCLMLIHCSTSEIAQAFKLDPKLHFYTECQPLLRKNLIEETPEDNEFMYMLTGLGKEYVKEIERIDVILDQDH